MAKCPQCGNSGPFLKLTDGICDKCTVFNLHKELIKAQDRCKHLDSLLVSNATELNAANREIERLTNERQELLLERSQLIAAGKFHSFAHRYPEPRSDSEYWTPDGQEFRRRITESLSYAYSDAEHASNLNLRIERLQRYLDLFDESREVCRMRGRDFENWFDETYNGQHDFRRRAGELLDECIVQKNIADNGGNISLDSLCDVIINIIREEDGILQRELGKRFDLSMREQVRTLLYKLDQIGAIRREKSGSSYELHLLYNGVAYSILTREPQGEILDNMKFCRFCSVYRPVYENKVCSVCRHTVW